AKNRPRARAARDFGAAGVDQEEPAGQLAVVDQHRCRRQVDFVEYRAESQDFDLGAAPEEWMAAESIELAVPLDCGGHCHTQLLGPKAPQIMGASRALR